MTSGMSEQPDVTETRKTPSTGMKQHAFPFLLDGRVTCFPGELIDRVGCSLVRVVTFFFIGKSCLNPAFKLDRGMTNSLGGRCPNFSYTGFAASSAGEKSCAN